MLLIGIQKDTAPLASFLRMLIRERSIHGLPQLTQISLGFEKPVFLLSAGMKHVYILINAHPHGNIIDRENNKTCA